MDTIIGIIKNPVGFVLCSFVIIIIFIVIREFWCWYYKTNKIYEELDDIHRHLIKVSKDITEILDEAMNRYNQAAEKGDPEAQYKLGLRYYDGKGVQRDYSEAVKWFTQAAEQGHKEAQYTLGLCYYDGKGVQRDWAEAAKWFAKAAEQGHKEASYRLNGLSNFHNTEDFRKVAERGDAEAQFKLGLRYYDGNGVRRDYAEAVKWFTQAAEQGHAYAQYYLGICYQTGTGINQDLKQAKLWYIKAAAQGHEYAQIKLSELGYVFF